MNLHDLTPVEASLVITGIGMAGIFIFMIIFYFVVVLLDKIFSGKE